jgi:hypothetical protein
MEQTAFLREIHAKLTQVFEENYMSQLPAIPGDRTSLGPSPAPPICATSMKRDLERECIAIHTRMPRSATSGAPR